MELNWKKNEPAYGNIGLSMTSKIVAVTAYFGTDVLCARILSLQEYAAWVYYTSVKTMLAYIVYLGLNTSAKVVVARSGNERERREYIKAGMRLRSMINIFFAVMITCFSQYLAMELDKQNRYSNFPVMFWAMGLLVLFESFFEFYKQLGYGLENYKFLLQVTSIEFVSSIVFTFLFLLVWKNVFGALWAAIASGIFTVFVCTGLLKKKYAYTQQRLDKKRENDIWKILLKYAFPLLACDLANLIALELDTSMIGFLSGGDQITIYNIGKKLVSKAGHVNLAIAGGVMTSFAVVNRDNIKVQRQKFKKFFVLNMCAAICVCLGLLFMAFGGVTLIYGKTYAGAKTVILLLIPYYLMFAASSFWALFLDFQGKTSFRSIVSIISTGVNLILNYIFIPKYGAAGATVTTLGSQAIYFAFTGLSAMHLWRKYKKQYQNA